ncbi:MAG: FCD domain-containing protein [Hyphomicrobiaceae bacterium]|nr:FCD domain-containing protein [Hyphomicrobiaceae bacterium]
MEGTAPKVRAQPSARSLVEAAYGSIRHDILAGVLAPGEKLRVEMLKDRYAVGASTLREALTRLVGESLVTSEEQRGFRVAPVSLTDFRDISATRTFIELEALRQSLTHGDDIWEAQLVATYHRMSKVEARYAEDPDAVGDEYELRNREFHRALVSACPSRWLLNFQATLMQQSERYRRLALAIAPIDRDVRAEHKAIFDAVLEHDIDKACEMDRVHIERTLEVLCSVLASGTGMPK